MVSLIGPYLCLLFRMCNAYASWGSLCFVCSWYLCFKLQLVCPMYDIWHVLHISSNIPLLSCFCILLSTFDFVSCCRVLAFLKGRPEFHTTGTATILLENKNLAYNKFTKEERELLNYSLQRSIENINIFHQKTPRWKIMELTPFYGC